MRKIIKTFQYALLIGIIAFCVQLIWEYVQCGIFYTTGDETNHTRLMLSATFGDMIMSVALYFLLVIVNKDYGWIAKRWRRHDIVIMLLYALFLSFYFEIHALHNGRWGYNPETMPLFPNTPIGLVPVIQLLFLLPLIFVICRKIITRK